MNILQSYGFLTEKIVCLNHVAQQTMKNSIFSFYPSTNQVFVLVKSVIWPFMDFRGGVQGLRRAAAGEMKREGGGNAKNK